MPRVIVVSPPFASHAVSLATLAGALDELGVPHEGIKGIGVRCILEFRGPADIALELFAPSN